MLAPTIALHLTAYHVCPSLSRPSSYNTRFPSRWRLLDRCKRLKAAAWYGSPVAALAYRYARDCTHKRFCEVTGLRVIWYERRQRTVVALNVELAIARIEFGETAKLVERFGSRLEPGVRVSASQRILARYL